MTDGQRRAAADADRITATHEPWLWHAARWPHPFDYSDLGPEPVPRPAPVIRDLTEYERHVASSRRSSRTAAGSGIVQWSADYREALEEIPPVNGRVST